MEKQYRVTAGMKLYEQVMEKIKGMIAQVIYSQGELLPSEKELMELMGVSRITVREALRQLSEAGLIETRKGKGSFVLVDRNQLDPQATAMREYWERFLLSTDARILLEPAIAQKAALTATPQEVARLEACLSDEFPEGSFHQTLVAMAHNPILDEWLTQLLEMEADPAITSLIPPARQKSSSVIFIDHHRKIFEAIRDGKSDYAYFYMKEHMEFVRSSYQEHFHFYYGSQEEASPPPGGRINNKQGDETL